MAFNEKYVTVTGGGLHDGSSEADAWTLTEAASNVAGGDRVNVKAGTYNLTSALGFLAGGGVTNPIAIRGYKTTIGDQDYTGSQRVAGTDIPLIVSNGSSARWYISGNYYHMENIATKNIAAYDFPFQFIGNYGQVRRCQFESTSKYMSCNFARDRIDVEDCYFKADTGTTALYTCNVHAQGASVFFYGCVFDGGVYGVRRVAEFTSFHNCIFINQTTAAIEGQMYGSASGIVGNTFYNMSGDAIQIRVDTVSPGAVAIRNNVFSDVAGTAINHANSSTSVGVFPTRNLFYNCGTIMNSDSFSLSRGNIVDNSSPLVDPASGDYSLKVSSGGYGKSEPNPFEVLAADSRRDLGAVQHEDPVGNRPNQAGSQIYPFRHLVEDFFEAHEDATVDGNTDQNFHPLGY